MIPAFDFPAVSALNARAYYSARDDLSVLFSEYDADRIEWRKTAPAEAAAIAAAELAARKQVAKRITIERRVVRRAVRALIAAGYHVAVDNGEELSCRYTQRVTDVMAAIQQTDVEWLRVGKPSAITAGKFARVGTVALVYGNDGWDVLADYSLNLEDVLAPVNEYADTLSA